MPQSWKPFILGVVCALLLGATILFGIDHRALVTKLDISQSGAPGISTEPGKLTYPPLSPDAVKIQPLPPLLVLTGTVKFEGKKELPQKISGNFAKNIIIVNFTATGENADKSMIKVVWMDGSVDMIPPGISNFPLTAGKFAKQIIIVGYSMHERKIFKDSAQPGILEWEIRYEAVDE